MYFFSYYSKDSLDKSVVSPTPGINIENANYYDATARVDIDDDNVLIGNLVNISADGITISTKNGDRTFSFVDEEVVLACSSQELEFVQVLDYEKMESVHAISRADLGDYLPVSDRLVLFREKEGEKRVHSVAVSNQICEDNNLR